MQQLYSLPNPAGLFCAKALFWDEKRPPPVLVVPNRLFDVPVDVPNPKPVLVEEVAGWLNVVEPNNPPEDRNRLLIFCNQLLGFFRVFFRCYFSWWLLGFVPPTHFNKILLSRIAFHYNHNTTIPGFVWVLPKRPPVLLFDPKADVPNAPPLVVPKPASEKQHYSSDETKFLTCVLETKCCHCLFNFPKVVCAQLPTHQCVGHVKWYN